MGKYHPHGDLAIYDALVRMAQPFSLRHPLVDCHGNFGSLDDGPAAARYTECRLSAHRHAHARRASTRTPSTSRTTTPASTSVPTVLPARFPNLLVNGSQGIAVGHGHQHPAAQPGRGHRRHHPPDRPPRRHAPTISCSSSRARTFRPAAFILGRQGIMDAYRTGRGSIKMRAKAEIVETKRGDDRSSSRELPYQASPQADPDRGSRSWSTPGSSTGSATPTTLSAKGDTRLVIDLKRDANANVVLNNLYKHTPLQTSFGVNMVALVDGVPRTLNLVQALHGLRRPPGRGDPPPVRVPAAEGPGPGPHRRGPDQGPRHDRRHHRRHPGVRGPGQAAIAALQAEPFEFSDVQADPHRRHAACRS